MKYVAVISDAYDSATELEKDVIAWCESRLDRDDILGDLYEFELPDGTELETAGGFGRGLFFYHDWSSDGTVSVVMPFPGQE